jgi:hypothetical protein
MANEEKGEVAYLEIDRYEEKENDEDMVETNRKSQGFIRENGSHL